MACTAASSSSSDDADDDKNSVKDSVREVELSLRDGEWHARDDASSCELT